MRIHFCLALNLWQYQTYDWIFTMKPKCNPNFSSPYLLDLDLNQILSELIFHLESRFTVMAERLAGPLVFWLEWNSRSMNKSGNWWNNIHKNCNLHIFSRSFEIIISSSLHYCSRFKGDRVILVQLRSGHSSTAEIGS